MLHKIYLQKCPLLCRTCHTNIWNMSKASPRYLISSTGEITNHNGYINKVCMNSVSKNRRIARHSFTYTQADNGGARGTLPCHTASGVEHPNICDACPCILLRTYRGGGLVGCAETKKTHVWSDLPNVHQWYPVVTMGASSSGSGSSGGVRSYREEDGGKQVEGRARSWWYHNKEHSAT